MVDNIRDGLVDDAQFLISIDPGMAKAGPLPSDAVDVAFNYHDMTAEYMRTMPPIKHGGGHAKLTARTLDVYMDTGDMAGDLMLRDGALHITGIGIKGAAAADIETVVDGPATALLAVLDNEPLGYPTKFGIPPKQVSGRAATRAKFQFPLGSRLALDRVRFSAAANLNDITVEGIFGKASMTDGRLQLLVNNGGLEALGNVTMFGVPLDMTWTDDFKASEGAQSSKYVFTGILEERNREELFPLIADYIAGPVPLDIELVNSGPGQADGHGTFNLRDAVIDAPMLSWAKARDVPGTVTFAFTASEKGLDVKSFDVRGGGLTANGHLLYTGQDLPGEFNIERISVGKTDIAAHVARDDAGGYAITIKGASFDAGPLIDSTLSASGDKEDLPNLTFSGTVDRLITLNDVIVHNVAATVIHHDKLWREATIHGDLDNGKTLDVSIKPEADHRTVSITSDDAGTVIRALDMYDNARGGKLTLAAEIDDTKPENPMTGRLQIDNFSVVKAPGLAKVLTLGSLTGISNRLRREGLTFKRLEAPFQFHSRILRLGESRAVGPAIGFTLEGVVDQNRDLVDLKGTIVPAYTINKFLAGVPLIGTILAGGDSEGIFAFTYDVKGTVGDPQMNVNPLSGLAPGLLRKIVSGDSSERFDREAAAGADAKKADKATDEEPKPTN